MEWNRCIGFWRRVACWWLSKQYAKIWRQEWADTANRYLEANDRPERLDLRSYARQGIDQIPIVHMGAAACQMEKKGIQTNIGNLNRDIKTANRLMQSIQKMVRSLKGWLSDLKEKKAVLLEALEQAKEPTLPELLFRYLELRSGERQGNVDIKKENEFIVTMVLVVLCSRMKSMVYCIKQTEVLYWTRCR